MLKECYFIENSIVLSTLFQSVTKESQNYAARKSGLYDIAKDVTTENQSKINIYILPLPPTMK